MHFWSCDITKHGIYKIGHILAIFKDKDFWFGPKNSIKVFAKHFTFSLYPDYNLGLDRHMT